MTSAIVQLSHRRFSITTILLQLN